MRVISKKTFTLAEVLLATFILVVIGAVLVSMVASSSIALERTRSSFALSAHASSVFEHIKGLNRTSLCAQKDNATYWQALVGEELNDQTLNLTNVNSADTSWADDPLGLRLELKWSMRGNEKTETYLSYFTFDDE